MSHTGIHLVVFDRQLSRHYDVDEQGRLSERRREGLDARPGDRTATHDNAAGLHKAGIYDQMTPELFVAHVASQIDQEVEQGKVARLHIAADPTALGWFREAASARVNAATASATPKDYVHTPVKEIEAALAGVLKA